MPLREELRNRRWPTPFKNVEIGDYLKGCYVREGHMVNTSAAQRGRSLNARGGRAPYASDSPVAAR